MSDLIPASTLILVRDVPAENPHILMIERDRSLAFAAGALVFPGGRIDPIDSAIAAQHGIMVPGPELEQDDLVARIAAIRETIEEVGVGVAIEGKIDHALVQTIRNGLHQGASLADLLLHFKLRIDPYRLTPYTRWIPRLQAARRFDTRFYVAEAPEDALATADGTETSHAAWATANAHIDDATSGRRTVIYPTMRNLERLAACQSYDDIIALANRHPMEIVSPWVEMRDGERWLCIPEHLGYPVTAESVEKALRG